MVWTDELNMFRGKVVAAGTTVVGMVLLEMIWGSTLETPEGISSLGIPGSITRERVTTRGGEGIEDGVLRGMVRVGDVKRIAETTCPIHARSRARGVEHRQIGGGMG